MVPVFDESANVAEAVPRLKNALAGITREVIFVGGGLPMGWRELHGNTHAAVRVCAVSGASGSTAFNALARRASIT